MKAPCPQCGNETELDNNPFRPFCCERCKLLDLGEWLSGSYAIPVVEGREEDEEIPSEDSGGS